METAYNIEDDQVKTKDYFRVHFYRNERPSNLFERAKQRAVKDYFRSFGYESDISHCTIDLSGRLYEVSLDEGCQVYQGGDHILAIPTMVAYWEIDLTGMDYATTQFMLDSNVTAKRQLDWKRALSYLKDYVLTGAKRDIRYELFPILNFLLPEGSMSRGGDELLEFHLPFTCATIAANAINHLFHLEPSYDSHLPPVIYMSCEGLANHGYGKLYNSLDALARYGVE